MKLPAPPWIAAHRGAWPLLENTIPALQLAVAEGADLVECDVQATADGVLVLFHDADLGRLAGRTDLAVETATLGELASQQLCHPEHPALRGRIPTLAGLLDALPGGFPLNIELKRSRSPCERLAELALEATRGRENVLFSSFDAALLRELRRQSATAHLAPLASRWTPGLERFGVELEAWSLHVSKGVARANAAAAGALSAPPLLVYTVNDVAHARASLEQGAAGLITDRPGGLRAEVGVLGDTGVLSITYRGTRALRRAV